MVWILRLTAVVLLLCGAVAHADAAVGELADGRVMVTHEAVLGTRFNPLGAAIGNRTSLRWMLFPKDSPPRRNPVLNVLLAPAHLGVGVITELTPAFFRAGVGVEFMPLALWRMRLTYHATQTFGSSGYMQSFDHANDSFSVDARRARDQVRGTLVPRMVHRLMAENLLQLKIWRVSMFNLTTLDFFTALEDRSFYTGEYDLLLRGRFELTARNTFVGVVSLLDGRALPEVAVGGFHNITRTLYTRIQNQQAGLAVIVGPPFRGVIPRSISWIILAGFHLQDRYRQNTPYLVWLMALGF